MTDPTCLRYRWDKERGVLETDGKGYTTQAIQLVGGTRRFRNRAGQLLVRALNQEAYWKGKR